MSSFLGNVFSLISKAVSGGVSVGSVALGALSEIKKLVRNFAGLGGDLGDRVNTVNQFWDTFDAQTGDHVDLVKDMPPDVEEALFDHIGNTGRILSLWAVGHYGTKPSAEQVEAVGDAISSALGPDTEDADPRPGPIGRADTVGDADTSDSEADESDAQAGDTLAAVSIARDRVHTSINTGLSGGTTEAFKALTLALADHALEK